MTVGARSPGRRSKRGDVRRRGQVVAHLHRRTVVELRHRPGQVGRVDPVPEDGQHGLTGQPGHDFVFGVVFERVQLDLARRRRHQGGEVADPGYGLVLPRAQGAARRRRHQGLVVGHTEAHGDAGPLVDLGALTSQLGDRGHDLGHVAGHLDLQTVEVGGYGLLHDDVHFGGGVQGVVGADLSPETVFQRRDDAASAGVVLGVGRRHEEDVEREADLVATDLDVSLLEHVEEADLDAFGQVGQFVYGEDASVGAGHEAVMKGQLVREVAPFGHLDGVDFADEVRYRGVRSGQFFSQALVAAHPLDGAFVTLRGHELAPVAGNGVVGVVEHLRAGDDR